MLVLSTESGSKRLTKRSKLDGHRLVQRSANFPLHSCTEGPPVWISVRFKVRGVGAVEFTSTTASTELDHDGCSLITKLNIKAPASS